MPENTPATECASCRCSIEVPRRSDGRYFPYDATEACNEPSTLICAQHLAKERADAAAEQNRLQQEIGRVCAELRGLVEAVQREDDARADLAGRILALRRTAVDAERTGTFQSIIHRHGF